MNSGITFIAIDISFEQTILIDVANWSMDRRTLTSETPFACPDCEKQFKYIANCMCIIEVTLVNSRSYVLIVISVSLIEICLNQILGIYL